VYLFPISCLKNALAKRQTMEYHHYTEYSKLCSEQCIKYWALYISSGLGAIIGACVASGLSLFLFFQGERLSKFSILGLIIEVLVVFVFFMII
jgi:hypothetical protein